VKVLFQEAEAQGAKVGVYAINASNVWVRVTGETQLSDGTYKTDALLRYRLK
jgi:hypothetical protein